MDHITPVSNPYAHIPLPAGAHHVGEWRLDGGTARSFEGTMRGLEVCVDIEGDQ